MVCVDYNIVKEGIMGNTTVSGAVLLSDVQLKSMYDGTYDTEAITISGTGDFLGVIQSFGESYDVCYARYYTDDITLSNIAGSFSTFSGTETDLVWYLETAGVYRADIDSQVRNLEVVHTVSSGVNTNVYQLYLSAEKNATLGFGQADDDIDFFEAAHATDKAISASPNVVPIFNDNHFDDEAFVAIAPTFTEEDNYIFLSTSEEGPYYGIDDYGLGQPGHKKSTLVTDPMSSGTLSDQWYLRTPAASHIVTRNQEGITFEIGDSRHLGGALTRRASGLLSSEEFTVQSFTAEIKIKLDNYIPYTDTGTAFYSRTIMFVLTNGYAIPDVEYKGSQTTRERVGDVTIGLVLNDKIRDGSKQFRKDDVEYRVRVTDGAHLDNRFGAIDSAFIGFSAGLSDSRTSQETGPSIGEFENINYEGEDFQDYTTSSKWRTWKIVYDHIKKKLSGYVDNIYIGSRIIREGMLSDGTRLFIGQMGDSNLTWSQKDFKITYDELYRQDNIAGESTATATISGTDVYKVLDGDTSVPYVGPEPTSSARVRINFAEPKDITSYSIKQRSQATPTTAYGKTYYPDVARDAYVDFGGLFSQVHKYPNSSTTTFRSPTYSGTAVVASGIDYIDFNFLNYDETAQANGALVIEQIQIFSEGPNDITTSPIEDENLIPWTEGVFHNTKLYGTSSALSLRDKSKIVLVEPLPEYYVEGVNYGFSDAAIATEYTDNYIDSYHGSSEIFYPTYHQDGGDYQEGGQHAWWTGPSVNMPAFAWQVFDEESSINSVYWVSDNFHTSRVTADKFKFQYLVPGGSPLVENDWADIPPVVVPHPYGSEINLSDQAYKEYKEYLFANNDGEYYTDYYDLVDASVGLGFSIGNATLGSPPPKGLPIPPTYMTSEDPSVRMYFLGSLGITNASRGYVHFDSPIRTRGLRMVVAQARSITTGSVVNEFGLADIFIFRDYGTGSYTSPVFDTGTSQNTERLKIESELRKNTNLRTFVRSSSNPPLQAHNNQYEFWESTGNVGNSQVQVFNLGNSSIIGSQNAMSSQVVGDVAYLFLDKPYAYDHSDDTWRTMAGGYPGAVIPLDPFESDDPDAEGESGSTTAYGMDTTVRPKTVLIGTDIYVAAKTLGNASVPRFMIYDTINDKWRFISGNRPPFAENSSMVASESQEELYFFNDDGTISKYTIGTDIWQIEDAVAPRSGDKGCTLQFEGKIYVFGGEDGTQIGSWRTGSVECWTFDTETKEIKSISDSPYRIYRGNALLVEEHRCVYILPYNNATSSKDAPQKYFFDEDRWEVVESLLSHGESGADPGQAGIAELYYRHGKYIYGMGGVLPRKTCVINEPWVKNKSPNFKDPVWGSKAGLDIPWIELGSFGEFMPQERYFQFKVELISEDLKNTPVVNSVRVVQPQRIPVPASGTSNVYVKIGAVPDKTYRLWYTSTDIDEAHLENGSLFYSTSDNGFDWSYGSTISGSWDSSAFGQPADYHTTSSIWTIRDTDTSYEHWFTAQEAKPQHQLDEDFYIRYSSSSLPDHIDGNITAISGTEIPEASTGAEHPCVLKDSPSSYDMWYTGRDATSVKTIIHATSSDGQSWASHARVLDIGTHTSGYDSDHAYRPSLLKEGSIYKMWYTGIDSSSVGRILYTESTDGLSWVTPITVVQPGTVEEVSSQSVTDAVVAYDGSQYVMVYVGTDGTDYYAIRAISPDGITWADHSITVPAGGISESQDSLGVRSLFFSIDFEDTAPSTTFTYATLKLHNDGASL